MAKGFFASSLVVGKAPSNSIIPKCGACGFFRECTSARMPYTGEGRKGILIVGDFPSTSDDDSGKHFTGETGDFLKETLASLGVNMRKDCWLTNAVICHPPGGRLKGKEVSVDHCRPTLLRTVNELKPTTIILLGQHAVRSLIGDVWKENPGSINRWVGWQIPTHKYNAWVCPSYSPVYLRIEDDPILRMYFKAHLREAVALTERPWKETPNWDSKIEVIQDTTKAAQILLEFEAAGGTIAFDYENTCLKPETAGGEILCASACWEGKRTIAFPWHGKAIDASRTLLHSKRCAFIASNLKHEDRWTRHVFGKPVRRWAWDTMLAAHTIDNREGITGLKFQSFVLLGMPSYNDHIEQFLRTVAGKKTNLAKEEVDLHQLLFYCGFDSYLEYRVAVRQCRILSERNASK